MYDYKNKQMNMRRELDFLLSKTLSMFQYQGLPETMPKRDFERQLQTKGYTFVTEFEGDLYSFTDGLGGEPDPYGNPTQIVIANPALDYNATLDLKEDGVLISNDSMRSGLRHLLRKYVYMMNESEVTMLVNSFNARVPTLISAGDDATRESAEEYLRQVVAGELGVIGENRIFEGINAQATGHGGSMYTQLIEYHQYLKASLYNELGLEMNHNMKRERLTEDEVNMVDTIYPFVDNMMMNRLEGIEAVNKMYGTEIKIAYDSVWGKHEGFDEEQFYDEISGYLGVEQEQEQQQMQEESSVLELEAILAELEALESEDETDGDITDAGSVDNGDSSESDTDDDRGEPESSESDGDNGSSGSARSDDRGPDGDDRHDASDVGERAGDGTDDEPEPDTGSAPSDDESSDREPDESDSPESDGGSNGDDTVREYGSRGSTDEYGPEPEGSGHDGTGDAEETDDDTTESGERTIEVTIIPETDTSTDTETEGPVDESDVVEVNVEVIEEGVEVNVEVTTDEEEVEETEEIPETEEDSDETQPDDEGTQEDTEDAEVDENDEVEEETEEDES